MKRGPTLHNAKKSPGGHVHSAKFRDLMVDAGLSQAGLAVRIGVGLGTVSAWHTGKRQPPGSVMAYLELLETLRRLVR